MIAAAARQADQARMAAALRGDLPAPDLVPASGACEFCRPTTECDACLDSLRSHTARGCYACWWREAALGKPYQEATRCRFRCPHPEAMIQLPPVDPALVHYVDGLLSIPETISRLGTV